SESDPDFLTKMVQTGRCPAWEIYQECFCVTYLRTVIRPFYLYCPFLGAIMHLSSARSIWILRIVWTIIALGIVIALGRALPLSAQSATPVFINEIHYDNTGTDAGEFVEVAGPAGTDLAG